MNSPLLDHKDFSYVRLLAVTWHANVLTPSMCTSLAGARLLQWVEQLNQPLIVNCAGISTIEDHSLTSLENFLTSNGRAVAFLVANGNERLANEIHSELKAAYVCSESIGQYEVSVYGGRSQAKALQSSMEDFVGQIKNLEHDFVTKAVRNCYKHFKTPERLDSTPLLASGRLNARALISDPIQFTWISLLFAEQFERVIEEARPRTNGVLAVSLRASPFAAAVRLLAHTCSPSLEIIDHIGPRHDLLEASVGEPDMYGREYILIADFVVGGTELKIARTYAMSQGATIKNAIAIGAFLSGDAYDKNIALKSLINIPEVVPELTYQFVSQGAR